MNNFISKQQAMLAGGPGTFYTKNMMTPIKEQMYEGSTATGDEDFITHMPADEDMSNAYAAAF